MSTITKTIRIPEDLATYIESQATNLNQGVITICERDKQRGESLALLRRYSENELKGKFTEREWSFFADSLNGTMITEPFRYIVSAFIAHNEDAEMLEGTASKYDLKIEELNEKCQSLTAAQLDALYARVEHFWDNCSNTNLEEWARELC